MASWKRGLAYMGIGLVIGVVGLGIWQKDNVQALWEGISYTDEQLKEEMETSKEKVKQSLEQYQIEEIRDLTVAEEEQLMKGEITVEEALSLVMNKSEDASDTPSLEEKEALAEKYELDQPTATENAQVGAEQIVAAYVEKMYTLQVTFLSELGAIEARARAVFAQLPKEERTLSTAKKLAPSFINEGLALESKCDAQVDALLKAFQNELQAVEADTTIVKNMRDAYQTQKRLKKAYYLASIK